MNALIIHRLIGVVLLVGYVYIWINKELFVPGLQALEEGKNLYYRASQGYDFIRMLPLVGIACLIMPGIFVDLFSPKYGLFKTNLMTPGFFVFVGYLCLVLSAGLWAFFI